MINRWLAEATSGTKTVGSGCYLTMIASFFKPDIDRDPDWFIKGGSIDARTMKNAHLIDGDREKGYTIEVTNFKLPDRKLGIYHVGKTN